MTAKNYLLILRIGIILSLLTVFLVFRDLLFPFITSKQLVFNVLMELLLAFAIVLWWKFPNYRPRLSLISIGLLAYFASIILSFFVSADLNLSFWGDAERMLGFFHLAHFLVFYFILITAFRTWEDWKILFTSSVLVATIESLLCWLGPMAYGSIGNTAYVSGYLIFNLFFLALLFLKEKPNYWRYFYFLPAIVILLAFVRANTSGAIIGLAAGIWIFIFLRGLIVYGQKRRYLCLAISAFLLAGVIFLFSQSQAEWFQSNYRLRSLTAQKNTFQTRLISWRGALQDFKKHPLLGVGYGNYAMVFDRQFDPSFYNFSRTETYFDRAHNNLIDIASTTGVVGLLAYLSIFLAFLYQLWRYVRPRLSLARSGDSLSISGITEFILLFALITAYFVQNLAVFDSLVTYMGLMIVLAYVGFVSKSKKEDTTEVPTAKETNNWSWLIIAILFMALFAYFFNFRPARVFYQTISSYGQIVSGDVVNGLESFKEALGHNTGLERDSRFTFIGLISNNPGILSYLSPAESADLLDYTISLAQKNLSYNKADSLNQLQLAQVADLAARFNYENQIAFVNYSSLALNAIDGAIKSSPRRPPLYFARAQLLLTRGEASAAIASMEKGISLNNNFPDGYCQLALIYFLLGEEEASYGPIDSCLDKGGVFVFSQAALELWEKRYSDNQDLKRLELLGEQRASNIQP